MNLDTRLHYIQKAINSAQESLSTNHLKMATFYLRLASSQLSILKTDPQVKNEMAQNPQYYNFFCMLQIQYNSHRSHWELLHISELLAAYSHTIRTGNFEGANYFNQSIFMKLQGLVTLYNNAKDRTFDYIIQLPGNIAFLNSIFMDLQTRHHFRIELFADQLIMNALSNFSQGQKALGLGLKSEDIKETRVKNGENTNRIGQFFSNYLPKPSSETVPQITITFHQ